MARPDLGKESSALMESDPGRPGAVEEGGEKRGAECQPPGQGREFSARNGDMV